MNQSTQSVDEYTLAAFLAGTLSEAKRKEVIACLAQNQDARELLRMSYQALEAAGESRLVLVPRSTSEDAPPVEPARQSHGVSPVVGLRRIMHYAAAAVVVFAIGLGVRLSLNPSSDQYRSEQSLNSLDLKESGSGAHLAFQWSKVEHAFAYRVVVWNPSEATVVSEGIVNENRLEEDSPLLSEIKTRVLAGQVYQLRVDAVDAQNRLLQSSDLLEFQVGP